LGQLHFSSCSWGGRGEGGEEEGGEGGGEKKGERWRGGKKPAPTNTT